MKINSFALIIATLLLALGSPQIAAAQCTEVVSGLREPVGTAWTNQGNLLVAEAGTPVLSSGRISIIDSAGHRRTLIDGLPTGIADAGGPSGPTGLRMRGRTLYVAIGTGDVARPGPFPGTAIPNPNPISSPIFASVLAIQFSAAMEQSTSGLVLTPAHEEALAAGEIVRLGSGRETMTIHLVVKFPNYVPNPLPNFAGHIAVSNPFDLVAIEDVLYVTDGGRNHLWRVDLTTGAFAILSVFPPVPNPLFGIPGLPGGPTVEAVPTGIAVLNEQLYVTLFRGVPFPPGISTVELVDPATGNYATLIGGRKNAIDVLPLTARGRTSYLVLQHASVGPFFGSPGQVLSFDDAAAPPTVLASCLTRPTSMTLDARRGELYVTEVGGRLVRIALP